MSVVTLLTVIFGMLAAFLAGAYVTYAAISKQSPMPKFPSNIANIFDDLPDPVSPYEEAKKVRRG